MALVGNETGQGMSRMNRRGRRAALPTHYTPCELQDHWGANYMPDIHLSEAWSLCVCVGAYMRACACACACSCACAWAPAVARHKAMMSGMIVKRARVPIKGHTCAKHKVCAFHKKQSKFHSSACFCTFRNTDG